MTIFSQSVCFGKAYKEAWTNFSQRGDLEPLVLGIQDGEVQAFIHSPNLDKNDGLKAIYFLRLLCGIDEAVMLSDGHTVLTEGKSEEELEKLYEKYVGKNRIRMQEACDKENACELGEIADTLMVSYINKKGRFATGSYPYYYHGKGGSPFRWLSDQDKELLDAIIEYDLDSETVLENSKNFAEESSESEPKIGGKIPELMHQIIQLPTVSSLSKFDGVLERAFLEDDYFFEKLSGFPKDEQQLLDLAKELVLKKAQFDIDLLEKSLAMLDQAEKEADNNGEILLRARLLREATKGRKEELTQRVAEYSAT